MTGAARPNVPSDDALCYATVDDLIAWFTAGEVSPVDVLEAQIARIEALNGHVNAITDEHFESARREARESEKRYRRGEARPLEGVTVAIKDEFARPGWRVTQGSLVFKDSAPAVENDAIIDALEAAGAVMPFQTTVPEFWLFAGASTRAWGTTRTPWNLQYSPGGSSAGSGAALAAGFVTLATGSDMGGSIRIPAAQNGLYGFRPPFGRVASGEIPFSTAGPLARSFADLVHFQNAITGPSEKVMAAIRPRLHYPPDYPDLTGWRVAVDWGTGIAEPIASVKDAMGQAISALRAAGCTVDEVDCGFAAPDKFVYMHGLMSTPIGTVLEIADTHRELLSPYVGEMLDQIGAIGPSQAAELDVMVERLHQQVQRRVFGKDYRVLLMPTMATPFIGADMFHSHDEGTALWDAIGLGSAMTWQWNVLNRYPIVNVPLGLVEPRMPVGMQVIGQTFTDLDAFQFASTWSRLQPPLFADDRFPTFS